MPYRTPGRCRRAAWAAKNEAIPPILAGTLGLGNLILGLDGFDLGIAVPPSRALED